MATSDVYELNLEYGVHERPMTVNLWYQVVSDPTNPSRTAQDIADAFADSGLYDVLGGLMSTQARWDQIRTYLRVPAAGGEAQAAPGFRHIDAAGLYSGNALPDSLPLVIEWEQTQISAKANGRCFLSGIPELAIDGNRCSAAYLAGEVASFITNWSSILTTIPGPDGGSYRQVLMSKHLDLLPYESAVYGSPIDVTTVSVNPMIKNQKRRQSRWESTPRT